MATIQGTQPPFVPNCCKLWFPMRERVGTTLLDIAGGAVLTPTEITHGTTEHAIRFKASGAGASQYVRGIPLTSGSLPIIGTKDFILFTVEKHGSGDVQRVNSVCVLADALDVDRLYTFDGDGALFYVGGQRFWTETFTGADSDYVEPNSTANGIVRNGSSIGLWTHATETNRANQGSTVGDGDIYARWINAASGVTRPYGRNDYGFSPATIASWQDGDGQNNVLSENGYNFGIGGLPGVWGEMSPVVSVPQMTRIQVGTQLPGANDFYGIALFVFDSGLPSDFKDALRWMKVQWMNGNKSIWPGWANL